MVLLDALSLAGRLIETGEKHQDYKRTTDLAETYRIYITGENIKKKLRQIVRREDKDLFEQRVNLTKSITPAIAASLRTPFNKVARNDRIRRVVVSDKDKAAVERIQKMRDAFYGGTRRKNRGVDSWFKTRFCEMQFIDPNSWVVIEWDAADSPSAIIKPRPFEVTADMAHNYLSINDEVKWLFVYQKIKIDSLAGTSPSQNVGDPNAPGYIVPGDGSQANTKRPGSRFTLYDEDHTVVFEEVDLEFRKKNNVALLDREQLIKIKETTYLVRYFEPKLGFAPAFRIGYKRDEATDARTFVNPWHDSLCYFDKTLKTVSELDLTMTLHAFPQKLQYVEKCKGSGPKKCNSGYHSDGSQCSVCKGSGWKQHTTAQDSIILPMPSEPQKDDLVDLDKLIAYKSPPIDLLKFQNEYCQQLERQAHQGVFNSQVFVKKSGGLGLQTATEAELNYESVYDTIEPFTEKLSELWVDFVSTFARLAQAPEDIAIAHVFPGDFKLKTKDVLLNDRKIAKDSGAPTFLIDSIDDDIASILYNGDTDGLRKFRVKKKFEPFAGSSEEEIASLLSSQFVPKEHKVLHSNFEIIFREIEREEVRFYLLDYLKQIPIVEAKVAKYMELLAKQAPVIGLDSFREGNPLRSEGAQGSETGNQNPGSDAGEDYQNQTGDNPKDVAVA